MRPATKYSDEVQTPSPYSPKPFRLINYNPIYHYDVSNVDFGATHSRVSDLHKMHYIAKMHQTAPYNGYLRVFAESSPSFALSKYSLVVNKDGSGGDFIDKFDNVVPIQIVIEYLKGLMKNKQIKLIFIYTIVVMLSDASATHSNWMIIDKPRKVVELFDPHGYKEHERGALYGTSLFWNVDLVEAIKKTFQHNKSLPELCFIPRKYKILRYIDSCPMYGFQHFESSYDTAPISGDRGGYCTMWCIFLLELRLTNRSMSTKDVQEQFFSKYGVGMTQKMLGTAFGDFIRKYTYFLELLTGDRVKSPPKSVFTI